MPIQAEELWRKILEPVGEAVFLREMWGRRPVVLAHNQPNLYAELCDLDRIEEHLFSARPRLGDLHLVRENQPAPWEMLESLLATPATPYSVQAFYTALGSGYTGVLHQVQTRWSDMARLANTASQRLRAGVNVNLYLTGPGSQGFNVHTDPHDTLVLQTHGAKHWVVYDRQWGPPGEITERTGEPLLEFELRSGDALYIPRGFPHAARTNAQFSVHATFGIVPLTWSRLAQAMLTVLSNSPLWQGVVPPARLAGGEVSEIAAEITAMFARLADERLVAAALTVADEDRGKLSRMSPPPSGYLRSLAQEITAETVVERRGAGPCTVERVGAEAQFRYLGAVVAAPAEAEAALRQLAEAEQLRVGDLVGLAAEERFALVRHLIVEGLLQVRRARGPAEAGA